MVYEHRDDMSPPSHLVDHVITARCNQGVTELEDLDATLVGAVQSRCF
jgi:hypothetical protein